MWFFSGRYQVLWYALFFIRVRWLVFVYNNKIKENRCAFDGHCFGCASVRARGWLCLCLFLPVSASHFGGNSSLVSTLARTHTISSQLNINSVDQCFQWIKLFLPICIEAKMFVKVKKWTESRIFYILNHDRGIWRVSTVFIYVNRVKNTYCS